MSDVFDSTTTPASPVHERPLAELVAPALSEMLGAGRWDEARSVLGELIEPEIAEVVDLLAPAERGRLVPLLPRRQGAEVFARLGPEHREELLAELDNLELAELFNEMSPDDRTDLFESMPPQFVGKVLALMRPEERRLNQITLSYPEETVGRLMTSDYLAIRPDWTVARAMEHIRYHARDAETLDTIYVVDPQGRLLDDVRIAQLIMADPAARVEPLMDQKVVALRAEDDREEAVRVMERYDRPVLPVIDEAGRLLGIVTFDDVADVAEEEATEDMQKMAAVEAFEEPYLAISLTKLIRKRATWLSVLFVGQMLTATAMAHYEGELAQAMVLAIFLPLIISSGGNSGSQAATLIIRAMATRELLLRDWFRVFRRELVCGLVLGLMLGAIGLLRIWLWEWFGLYDYLHYHLIGLTVGLSVVGVVTLGTLSGSMLPFVLRRLKLDPATVSAPFIATLVDVGGVVIYFNIALFTLSKLLN